MRHKSADNLMYHMMQTTRLIGHKVNIKSLYIKAGVTAVIRQYWSLHVTHCSRWNRTIVGLYDPSVQWWAWDHVSSPHEKQQWHAQSAVKILAAMSSNSQSTPSNKFSPVTALQPMIHQWWVLILSRASAWRKHTHCGVPMTNPTVIWHELNQQ